MAVAVGEVDDVDLPRRCVGREPEGDPAGLAGRVRLIGDLPIGTFGARGGPHLRAGDRVAGGGGEARAQRWPSRVVHGALCSCARDAAPLALAPSVLDADRVRDGQVDAHSRGGCGAGAVELACVCDVEQRVLKAPCCAVEEAWRWRLVVDAHRALGDHGGVARGVDDLHLDVVAYVLAEPGCVEGHRRGVGGRARADGGEFEGVGVGGVDVATRCVAKDVAGHDLAVGDDPREVHATALVCAVDRDRALSLQHGIGE